MSELTGFSELRMPLLVVVLGVPAIPGDGRVFLDIKAVDGLRAYSRSWPGKVRCLFRAGEASEIGYGNWYVPHELPFEIVLIKRNADAATIAAHTADAAIILASADNHLDLGLPQQTDVRVVFVIEYTLRTRMDILRVSRSSFLQKVKSALWLVMTEFKRRRAMDSGVAIQANGTPAYLGYHKEGRDDLLYFDTRLGQDMFIGRDGGDLKAHGVLAPDRPLRLAFSGRLEPMKGADHLVPIMVELRRRRVPKVTLDIFGDGSLRSDMEANIKKLGLSSEVRIHGPVDFASNLVPYMKESVDVFLCCHRQGDPSCTYMETMGCGVPVVGYRNDAFEGILALGKCGIGVRMDDVVAAASVIEQLNCDRAMLAELTRGAVAVAERHLLEQEFQLRIDHLRRVAGLPLWDDRESRPHT